ncbi:hypothetical protein TSUD_214970 [Trifolium subterraneum]|uniref:Late nodulin domain-containing protein n=1 Tax=Trifolium subterraneum TaxID=3900 RepID=A0A2Z6MGX9_TRISU|nr:hypothetical protein TSUD_214970 [Trifolium subterraneum]
MAKIHKSFYVVILFLSLSLIAAEFDADYFEPPCQTDDDCEPAWNEYFNCKCVDFKCKWIMIPKPEGPKIPKIPM